MRRLVMLVSFVLGASALHADIIHVPGQYPTIQQGIDAARAGDIVLVAPGRYPEEILLKASVIVRGAGEGRSIIDGQGDAGDVVRAIGNAIGPDTKLEGFTITGAANGGGMPGGGGVFCNSGARPDIGNCRIEGNDAGVALWNGSTAYIHNCVVANNTYDGISTGAGATIVNNTIHGNRIGFYDYSGYGPVFMNNIVTGSSLYGVYGPSGGSPPQLTYNDVWGNAENYRQATPGTGSDSVDPQYVDTLTGDFHLSPGSPCIDHGNPAAQYNDPDGSRNDMGAYGGPGAGSNRPEVITLLPSANALHVNPATDVGAGFNVAMDWTTVTSRSFAVRGAWTGTHYGAMTFDTVANVVTVDPDSDFVVGEPVSAVLSKRIVSALGDTFAGFAWDFTTKAAGGSGRFSVTRSDISRANPLSLVTGDFNSDGHLDVASCSDLGKLGIFLGRGDGTFETERVDSFGGAWTLCCADFNGDSALDLALAMASNQVGVLLGQGDGEFDPPVRYACGNTPIQVVAADLDVDGDMDLAAACFNGQCISVLLNNGDGTFAPAVSTPDPGAPAGLATGDLNLDGFPDLVSANMGSYDLAVFLGDGDGTFDSLARYAAGYVPFRLSLADFSEDGVLDVVAINQESVNVVVYLGDGTGRMGGRTNYVTSAEPASLLAADFDADGHDDLAIAGGSTVNVFPGRGNGSFGARTPWSSGSNAMGVTPADLDEDGDLDMVVGRYENQYVTVMFNDNSLAVTQVAPEQHAVAADDSTGLQAGFSLTLNPTTLDSTNFLAFGAMTGLHRGGISYDSASSTATLDPRADFAAGEQVSAMLTNRVRARSGVYLRGFGWDFTTRVPSGSAGTFGAQSSYSTGAEPRGEWCADFDGDGDIDVATTSNSPAAVCMLRNNGDGTFASPVYTTVVRDPISLFGADLDSDGDLDLACFHNEPGSSHLEILKNNGTGVFTVAQTLAPAVLGQQVWGGDLDADGDVDLVLSDGWGSQDNVRVMTNNGSGTFSGPASYSAGSWARGVAVTDVDNDGDMDICVANSGNDNVSVLYNDGRGGFSTMANFGTGAGPDGLHSNDLNADGWVDLVTAHLGGTQANVLLNRGDGSFAAPAAYGTRVGQMKVCGGDFDGDADIDLAFSAYNADSAAVLLNDGHGVFSGLALYGTASPPWHVATADFNRDGALDLALPCYSSGSVSVFLATGLGLASGNGLAVGRVLSLSPNPFSTVMAINLNPGIGAGARVMISDVAGRAVRTYQALPGRTSLVWDAKDGQGRHVAPGIYFVKLEAGGLNHVEKAILTR